MKEGLELEKVKVLPSPLSPIMNRWITRNANWAPQSFGITSEIKSGSLLVQARNESHRPSKDLEGPALR
jgi:hypothetical protein